MNTKSSIAAVAVILIATGICADDFRTFKDAGGRGIQARLLSFNPAKNVVKVELKNKAVKSVKTSVFSEEDQTYILNWHKETVLLSKGAFRLSADEITLLKDILTGKHSTHEKNTWQPFSPNLKIHDIAYQLKLKNQCGQTVEDLQLEYCIYDVITYRDTYFQHREYTDPDKPSGMYGGRGSIKTATNTTFGTWNISELQAGKESKQQSEIVRLKNGHEEKIISREELVQRETEEDELLGIRIRLHIDLESGKRITKEYSFPEKLASKTEWLKEQGTTNALSVRR